MKSWLLILLLALSASAQTTGVARLESMPGNRAHGSVWFVQREDGKLHVVALVIGLKPSTEHGLHIHALGQARAVNLGLLKADDFGVGKLDAVFDNVSLADLMSRPVILHDANSEISANISVGSVGEADARAMQDMLEQTPLGSP